MAALFECGVNYLDTAPAYGLGESERIIGRFCRGRRDQFFISTKIGTRSSRLPWFKRAALPVARALQDSPFFKRQANRQSAAFYSHEMMSAEAVERSVRSSMKALRTGYLDQVLLHNNIPEHLADTAFLEKIHSLKKEGAILRFGLAVHSLDDEFLSLLKSSDGLIDTVQLPFRDFPGPAGFGGRVNFFSLFSGAHGGGFDAVEEKIRGHKNGHFIVSMSSPRSVERNLRLFGQ